jgi:hypothetical protein
MVVLFQFFCVKVDVMVVHVGDVPFMHPHEPNDQSARCGRHFYLVELEVCEGRT